MLKRLNSLTFKVSKRYVLELSFCTAFQLSRDVLTIERGQITDVVELLVGVMRVENKTSLLWRGVVKVLVCDVRRFIFN